MVACPGFRRGAELSNLARSALLPRSIQPMILSVLTSWHCCIPIIHHPYSGYIRAKSIMLLPSRAKMQELATPRMPSMAADAHMANHRPLCRRQCQQYNFRRMRTAGQPFGRQLRCNAEVAEADIGPSTSSQTTAVLDFDSDASTAEVPKSDTWELDFSSRPILDSRGKKRWELLITSPDRSWVYSKWFPNNKINSTQVCSSPAILQSCHRLARQGS